MSDYPADTEDFLDGAVLSNSVRNLEEIRDQSSPSISPASKMDNAIHEIILMSILAGKV